MGGAFPEVLVPARIARILDVRLGSWRAEMRGRDPELDEVLAALHHVGVTWAVSAGSASGTPEPDVAEPVVESPPMTTAEAAEVLDVSDRWVRHLEAEGRLRNVGTARSKRFERAEVELLRKEH